MLFPKPLQAAPNAQFQMQLTRKNHIAINISPLLNQVGIRIDESEIVIGNQKSYRESMRVISHRRMAAGSLGDLSYVASASIQSDTDTAYRLVILHFCRMRGFRATRRDSSYGGRLAFVAVFCGVLVVESLISELEGFA